MARAVKLATSASLLDFGGKRVCCVLAMAARFKLLKCLFFLFLLVGDIGPQPASLEAHLPRAPPQEDQANLLFSPAHFCLLDFRHSFSSLVAVVALLFMFGVGFFPLSLTSVVLHLCGWLWIYLRRSRRYINHFRMFDNIALVD